MPKNIKIAHVEDDPSQRELIKKWLEIANFNVISFESAEDFLLADVRSAHCFVFDWELGNISGIDLVQNIRSRGITSPVLFATLRNTEVNIVEALKYGADDYLVKPLRQQEFIARIYALLRRSGLHKDNAIIDTSPYVIDLKNGTIFLDNKEIALTRKEFLLATHLFKHNDEIVSRDEIMEKVWGQSTELTTRTVDTHISRLRTKLNFGEETGWKLHSIYLHGYRLKKIV